MKYRKKPIVIDAIQWIGDNQKEIIDFFGTRVYTDNSQKIPNDEIRIETLEGQMIARPGDWIIRGINGEYYPCKPDIFEKTYEKVE